MLNHVLHSADHPPFELGTVLGSHTSKFVNKNMLTFGIILFNPGSDYIFSITHLGKAN